MGESHLQAWIMELFQGYTLQSNHLLVPSWKEFHHGISSSIPNSLPSLVRVELLGNQSGLPEPPLSPGQPKIEFQGTPNFHPYSLPEYQDGLINGAPCNSPGMDANFLNGSCSPGHHYIWSNSNNPPQPQGMIWPNGVCTTQPPPRLHAFPSAPSHMMNTLLPMNNHHVGSAPSVNPSLWERRHTYYGESPNVSCFHHGSLGNMRISDPFLHPDKVCWSKKLPSFQVGV
ncbi:hypothetical protein TEA_012736 [Camellia sinensis var. sinensis]|uniref:Uncharacterized protein n=1 Tax=Camellia sinensis var. sinensis TaxID=542762 RepID=A0A4S4D6S6_CAMSN|nr:hypothetical protein TEA_012736 [Camellia sinensis var. sinensis]